MEDQAQPEWCSSTGRVLEPARVISAGKEYILLELPVCQVAHLNISSGPTCHHNYDKAPAISSQTHGAPFFPSVRGEKFSIRVQWCNYNLYKKKTLTINHTVICKVFGVSYFKMKVMNQR